MNRLTLPLILAATIVCAGCTSGVTTPSATTPVGTPTLESSPVPGTSAPDSTLPTGEPNPNFLEPFSQSQSYPYLQYRESKNSRLALGYVLKGTRLGDFQFNVIAGTSDNSFDRNAYRYMLKVHADPRQWPAFSPVLAGSLGRAFLPLPPRRGLRPARGGRARRLGAGGRGTRAAKSW